MNNVRSNVHFFFYRLCVFFDPNLHFVGRRSVRWNVISFSTLWDIDILRNNRMNSDVILRERHRYLRFSLTSMYSIDDGHFEARELSSMYRRWDLGRLIFVILSLVGRRKTLSLEWVELSLSEFVLVKSPPSRRAKWGRSEKRTLSLDPWIVVRTRLACCTLIVRSIASSEGRWCERG